MAQGSKEKYTTKQKLQAKHIEDSEKDSGKSSKAAARIAWATVNKTTGGAGKAIQKSALKKSSARSH